jgi:hypothetical protein
MLKVHSFLAGLAMAAAVLAFATTSQAATLYQGWDYAIDTQNDGSGGSLYEYKGLAFHIVGNTAYVAISSGMPLGGNPVNGALNGRISNGDMFFNFFSHSLTTAANYNDPLVFGIRFDASNDSLTGVSGNGADPTLGVFKNVSVTSLTTQNDGWSSLQNYNANGYGRTTNAMGDLQSTTGDVENYFGSGAIYGNMLSGTKIGDITLLNRSQLTSLGVDFGHFSADPSGNNLFGFSFNTALLPTGNFTASLFEECGNDGMAIQDTTNVPEPGAVTIMAAVMISGTALLKCSRRKSNAKAKQSKEKQRGTAVTNRNVLVPNRAR